MALIDLFNSQEYRGFIKRMLLIASIVTIAGAIMLLTHVEGGRIVICLGIISLAVILVSKVIEIIVKQNN